MMLAVWVSARRVVSWVNADVSEKHTVAIFMSEVTAGK
jgi:hypothetical protein